MQSCTMYSRYHNKVSNVLANQSLVSVANRCERLEVHCQVSFSSVGCKFRIHVIIHIAFLIVDCYCHLLTEIQKSSLGEALLKMF